MVAVAAIVFDTFYMHLYFNINMKNYYMMLVVCLTVWDARF